MGKGQNAQCIVRVDILKLLKGVLRWTPTKKQLVLRAIHAGIVTRDEVLNYGIEPEELDSWSRFRLLSEILPSISTSVRSQGTEASVIVIIDGRHFAVTQLPGRAPKRAELGFKITPFVYKVFALLMENIGLVVSRQHIYDVLYRGEDIPPREKIIDVFINKLRDLLESLHANVEISTVWGRGYSLRHIAIERVGLPTESNQLVTAK